jgi:5'-nucleotidase
VVEVNDGGGWLPIDRAKLYLVVSNNYMRAGGDGYAVLRDKAKNAYDYGPDLADVLTAYLQAHRPYKPFTDGRIKDVTPKIVDSTKTPVAAPKEAAKEAAKKAETAPATPAKMPDLPAGSMKLATEPPVVKTAPAAKADEDKTKLPDLPAASSAIAGEPPKVTTESKPEAGQPPAAEPSSATTHVVTAGDNYWSLAKTFYGDPALWRKIAEANPTYRAQALPVGAKLKIPAK